ncbi:putative ubiquitin-conjugating enzyme E2 38 [Rutidosis leptorrhynchoides]|uniref:putative ubiquitin-conjugating enzyme E2 38 n=1 Tax=Rutidosis leptorrhynchoides TaxID=125765 RepID=UPI003A9A3677
MDILRAAIIGAEGTPYHDGLFFFDVCFPRDYPNSPPLVKYHSGGLHINPNLYKSGKVCLSLLNTWKGGNKEKWLPDTSTMLQVLVSIQGLILNTKPYFNEPGFAHLIGNVHGERRSLEYNERILPLSLKTMVYTMNKPPKNFEELVVGHFRNRVGDILMACKAYMEGVQVGCFVRGGVQIIDNGDTKRSAQFKNSISTYIKTLVAAFKKIGANEADEFLNLREKKFSELLQHYLHRYQLLLILLVIVVFSLSFFPKLKLVNFDKII